MLKSLVLLAALQLASGAADNAEPPIPAVQKPRIAIVVDDLGHHVDNIEFTKLGFPLTLAIMPFSTQAEALAAQAANLGHEVMIHMPMQPESVESKTQEVLDVADTKAQFIATLSAAFSRLPQASGLNNHQGSLMTAQSTQMQWLMKVLKERQMYFLDSRTSVATVAEATAREAGVPTNRRHVFLDNDPSLEAIGAQWQQVELIANKQGYAVVIGHPYPTTLQFLRQLETHRSGDYELVYFSQLVCRSVTSMLDAPYCD